MKSKKRVTTFSRTYQKASQWMSDIGDELPCLNGDQCYHLFRAVIQALRDRMTIDEAAQFSAQLPLVLRGTFFECWNPKSRRQGDEDFPHDVRQRLGSNVELHFDLDVAIRAVLQVITNRLSEGEVGDIYKIMPKSIRHFFPSEVSARVS